MLVCHKVSLKTETLAGNIQLACRGDVLALPYARSAIAVWNLQHKSDEPVLLEGHRRSVTALAFSHSHNPMMLCSATAHDYIIQWNMDQIFSNKVERSRGTRGQVICQVSSSASHVSYISYSPDDQLVAVSADRLIYIGDVPSFKVTAVLEGHSGNVNCAEFCPHYTSTLVSVSDDRTFRVWGIASSSLLYQSTIISSSPFTRLAMHPTHQSFAVGSADGLVRIYDLADGHDFRCLHQVDVGRLLKHYHQEQLVVQSAAERIAIIGGSARCQHSSSGDGGSDSIESGSQISTSVVGLAYICSGTTPSTHLSSTCSLPYLLTHGNDSVVSELLSFTPTLFIATTGAVLRVNANSLELEDCFSLQGSVSSESSSVLHGRKDLTLSSNAAFTQSLTQQHVVWCVLGKHFCKEVDVLSVTCSVSRSLQARPGALLSPDDGSAVKSDTDADDVWWSAECSDLRGVISVLSRIGLLANSEACVSDNVCVSSAPLLANSPLKAELQLKAQAPVKPTKKSTISVQKAGSLNKKGEIVDHQPVTLHTKIKSSGYSRQAPRSSMFQPKLNHATKVTKSSSMPRLSSSSSSSRDEYPLHGGPPVNHVSVLNVAERPTAVNSLRFSGKGDAVVCALNNASAVVLSSSTKNNLSCTAVLAGHSQAVTCASWSHSGKLLITSSDDKTANVWSLGTIDPIMTFSTTAHNFAASAADAKDKSSNAAFSKPVRSAQFYYVDRFILLSSGYSFSLYKYYLDTAAKSDLQRYASNNKYKLVKSFALDTAQQLTAFSAINSFHSYIVLAAGSDKTVHVFDINAARCVRVMTDVHTRAVHHIAQNHGSQYVSNSNAVYDLFLTSAVTDGLKLWDLRSNRCVRRYDGHINRVHACTAQISPCCRYLAAGSEDKCAYVYDIRSGSYLHKLTGHTDTVLAVAFHPQFPQLLTSTLDGKIRLYSE